MDIFEGLKRESMKRILPFLIGILIFSVTISRAQSPITDEYVQHTITAGRQYIVAILKAGPNQAIQEDSLENEQMNHLKYFFTLREKGKLPIFGPFYDSGDLQGFCIFNTTSKAEVKRLLDADPHVKSGYLIYEVHSWYGWPGDALPKE